MRRTLALLLALAALPVLPARARAVDPALFSAVAREIPVPIPDKYDERAILAALLARPDAAAEFEADGRAALEDPKLKPLFIAKWRGRAAAYATTEVHRPGIDVSRTYRNWKEVLGPEGYAYVRQRLLTMSKADSDKLIGYLGLLDQKLQANDYKVDNGLFAMSGKIVNGILDAYRDDLSYYLAAPGTDALRGGAKAAAGQLAAGITARNAVAAAPKPPAQPAGRPAAKPAPPAKPAPKPEAKPDKPEPEQVAPPPPADSARGQLENAQRAGEGAGGVFDGGFPKGSPSGPVSGGASDGAGTPKIGGGLSPAQPRGDLAGGVKDAVPPADDLDARVAQAGKSGRKPYGAKAGLLLGGGGALLGGLLGLLIGGPVGALVGAALLGGAGYLLSKRL
ncbi:MAG: hypothetical protein HY926_15080 [Elusimicrobia bacterium]|nr:hypothetical protein [Elusimicrobiota bacterium]